MSDQIKVAAYQWSVGDSEDASDLIDRLTAENEKLREEVGRLEALLSDQQKWMDHISSERDSFEQERDQLKAQINSMKQAIDDLVCNSEGVTGLHQNGEMAPWDELLTGGRFEEWLTVFDDTPSQCLAAHNAEVIERAAKYCSYKPYNMATRLIQEPALLDYANQLRQQAKES